MRRALIFILILVLVGCDSDDEPLPTQVNPDSARTQVAQNATATAIQLATLLTHTPTSTRTPTATGTETNTPLPTSTRTPTPSDTPTETAMPTDTVTPFPSVTLTDTPTATFTPSITPTRALNPDAVVGENSTDLLVEPEMGATAVIQLAPRTALEIDYRTPDSQFFQVRLLNGQGNGWVWAGDLILFVPLENIPIQGGSGVVTVTPVPPPSTDLTVPQFVTDADVGTGRLFFPYEYATCGDTYWTGDGLTYSMEDFAFQGRYPRFQSQPIRVYVHGLPPDGDPAWELAISQAFAILSQAVRLERVDTRDLEFFQPWVTMDTLLADNRVDMVWHIADADTFAEDAPCDNPYSCSQFGFRGFVMGGSLKFGGIIYVPKNSSQRVGTLVHATMHALGLWVHSPITEDILAEIPTTERMSPRDIATLRCLYNAPPYGN